MATWFDVRNWLTKQALPLWASSGFDHSSSTFAERLTLEGAAVEASPRRLMVQARQIYSYTIAAHYGWISGTGDLVASAARAMVDSYYEADGRPGWVMSVKSSGQVLDATRDLYAHAFVLLGLAAAFQSTKDQVYLDLADDTLSFIDTAMVYQYGGYYPSLPPPQKTLFTQNPHMHLLEALLALYDIAHKDAYRVRADAIVSLFESNLFMPSSGTLGEYFDYGWIPADVGRGYTFEPGHHYEWVWLLKRYSELCHQPLSFHSEMLNYKATRHGHSGSGLIWAEVRTDGSVTDASFRLWPHTEAIKASLSRHDIVAADKWLNLLHNAFLAPAHPGGWHDRISADGRVMVEYMPASSFYHLVCAFGECERIYNHPDRRD